MTLNTAYNIGDKVWVVYEQQLWTENYKGPSGEVTIYSDTIVGIIFNEDGILYEVNSEGSDWIEEKNIILYNDTKSLVKRIKDLDDEISEREKRGENK